MSNRATLVQYTKRREGGVFLKLHGEPQRRENLMSRTAPSARLRASSTRYGAAASGGCRRQSLTSNSLCAHRRPCNLRKGGCGAAVVKLFGRREETHDGRQRPLRPRAEAAHGNIRPRCGGKAHERVRRIRASAAAHHQRL